LNDERLGFLYGNHIRTLIKGKTTLSRVQRIVYGLHAKGCYTDTQRSLASYTETIYTLFCGKASMRRIQRIAIVLLGAVVTVAALGNIPILRNTVPGRIVRWCFGEPGATQRVNDAADKLTSSGWDKELIQLSDQLMIEYAATATTLPKAPFNDRLLPIDRLPQKYHKLGGRFGNPKLVLRVDYASKPTAVVISWANMRHAIITYADPPEVSPEGFFVRQVNDRIYVIANES